MVGGVLSLQPVLSVELNGVTPAQRAALAQVPAGLPKVGGILSRTRQSPHRLRADGPSPVPGTLAGVPRHPGAGQERRVSL